ncbi:cobalt-zinc-cadmium efflux system protein [Antricoccus suffuscus]|uniref:Cobalt-zinc-cadmium efflux system protein n=1 Tax=Antricoccus suffuscus TaxID=1629062 RepID=A0A2T0YZF5_9ACTN|nr:cation diffusion facilitator family transporter [Antricoccus suffuscus]PRZ29274.1 cobalt-zinc-cadmium efflux system protein [Antricoccus suffuscus]
MGLGHSHSPAEGAAPAHTDPRIIRRMFFGLAILSVFLVIEVTVGVLIHSLSLLADAGHMLTDILALCMGIIALALARRSAVSPARTFGWHRAEVLTAMVNAVLLVGVAAYIVIEALHRLGDAPAVSGWGLIATAAAGLASNVAVALLLRSSSTESLAVRGAYMEVLADAASSVGVIVAGVITVTTGWRYADIVLAVAISLYIAPRAIMLGASALRILIQQSPSSVDIDKVAASLAAIDGVTGVHDLHIWSLTVGMDVVTVHLTTSGDPNLALRTARELLAERGLEHATIQVETPSDAKRCSAEVTW